MANLARAVTTPGQRTTRRGEAAMVLLRVNEESTRDDLLVCLGHLAARAGRTLRYDGQGRENPVWRDLHETIDEVLDRLERMP